MSPLFSTLIGLPTQNFPHYISSIVATFIGNFGTTYPKYRDSTAWRPRGQPLLRVKDPKGHILRGTYKGTLEATLNPQHKHHKLTYGKAFELIILEPTCLQVPCIAINSKPTTLSSQKSSIDFALFIPVLKHYLLRLKIPHVHYTRHRIQQKKDWRNPPSFIS
jgi:hypothetical protein